MKFLKLGGIASLSILALAACGQDNFESRLTSLQTDTTDIITALNTIQTAETTLGDDFTTDAQADESLANLSETTRNLSTREDAVADLETAVSSFNSNVEILKDNLSQTAEEGNDNTTHIVNNIVSPAETTSKSLQTYLDIYQGNLDAENTFYTSLSSEDTGFDQYQNGVSTINTTHQEAQEQLINLNEPLQNIQANIQSEIERLENAESEAGNPVASLGQIIKNKVEVVSNEQ